MSVPRMPEGFTAITPYPTVPGADRLLAFAKEVFDAEEIMVMRKPDGTIAHGCLRIGNAMLEFAEGCDEWGPMPAALHVYVEDVDATYKLALSAGAASLRAPEDMFYGERSAAVRDACGNNWYLARQTEVLSMEEINNRAAAAMQG